METESQTIRCSGIDLEVLSLGKGMPLLYLHGGLGPDVPDMQHLKALGKRFCVIAPRHPGFGQNDRPQHFRDVADLAYLYLNLITQLDLSHGVLMGASFGGWIAAEMMVRQPDAVKKLVLSAPLGIKVRDREERDIADLFAMTEAEFQSLAYADQRRAHRDIGKLNDSDLAAYFRAQESLAAYSWEPYMHNPQLKQWLSRISAKTLLLSGKADRFVFAGYHEAYAAAIPGAKHHRMTAAGHFPHVEQAEAVSIMIAEAFTPEALNA